MEFWSPDKRFGLRIGAETATKLLDLCARARGCEVAGILVGYYTDAHSCAIVTDASGLPEDSTAGHSWVHRGIKGLQEWLSALWQKRVRQYYLGEWHFHPGAAPDPSDVDARQLNEIAGSQKYRCPEPVLLIIGGTPAADWTARAFVFANGKNSVELCGHAAKSNAHHEQDAPQCPDAPGRGNHEAKENA